MEIFTSSSQIQQRPRQSEKEWEKVSLSLFLLLLLVVTWSAVQQQCDVIASKFSIGLEQ